jgi:hypothetical protein
MSLIELIDKHWTGVSWFSFTTVALIVVMKSYIAHQVTKRIRG